MAIDIKYRRSIFHLLSIDAMNIYIYSTKARLWSDKDTVGIYQFTFNTPISTYRRFLIFIEFKILIVLTVILKTK